MITTGMVIFFVIALVYVGAVTYVFRGLGEIRARSKQITADLEDIREHTNRVNEALMLWNYGAEQEAIDLLRECQIEAERKSIDA